MWEESRDALVDLALASRESVLDVGCGTGELTRVLREECPARVVGLDADPGLLEAVTSPVVRGDATGLPFQANSFELVVCQALLINLSRPIDAVQECGRVASDAVAAIEPDNGAVTVESTVDSEQPLARRARKFYLDGVDTDVTLGNRASDVFETAGLDVVGTRRYDHVKTISPPYSHIAVEAARRKATGEGLADDRAEILASGASVAAYDSLREEWRAMGRQVIRQMQTGAYERTETVPFFVTVARIP